MKAYIFILLAVLPYAVFAQLPTSGLVAWYPFCGNANDYSGNGLDLTVVGPTLTTDRFGSVNCAYYFSGSTTGINNTLHRTPPLPTDTTDFTYSCWFEPDVGGNMQIIANGDCDIVGYELAILGTTCCASVGNDLSIVFGGINMYLTTPVTLNQWHHAVMRRTINNFDLFIDTVLIGSFTGTFNPTSPGQDFAVGENYVSGVCSFQGKIDDIAIYNRALSDAEIRQLYHYDPVCTAAPPIACDSISLPDTLHTCSEIPVTLPATLYGADSIVSIAWTPTTGLSDPAILNPILSAPVPGWYYLTVQSIIAGNLVVNGDFSAGNTGFTSAYPYAVSGPGALLPAGVYTITTDPAFDNPYVVDSFGDHTTGTGNMMAINGASTPIDVWCETIAVSPGTYYNFSAWFANWSSDTTGNLPIIQFEMNGTLTGPIFVFPAPDGLWTQFATSWYSGTNTSVTMCINDQQTAAVGNDFAIDDISLQQLCIAMDSVYIAITNPGATGSGKDTSFCSNVGSIILNAPAGYTSYLWNTGAATTSIIAYSGTYWVNASISCASLIDTFYVTSIALPIITLGNDTTICTGNSITLNAPQPIGSQYLWSNGSTSSSISVTSYGTYTLKVTQNGCTASSSVSISELNKPAPIDLGPDTILCNGDQLTLSVNDSNGSLLWSTGNTKQEITVTEPGNYWVTASNICGSVSDTVNVNFELCDIWFPSAFTPNGDGLNDIIRAVGNLQRYNNFSLSIYNRWGQRVFYTEDIYEGWNGKFNGVNQDVGTYYYMMYYSLEGKNHMMKGDLELIR